METLETANSVVSGDFEIGDRVYHYKWKDRFTAGFFAGSSQDVQTYGTVTAVDEEGIGVTMDDGTAFVVPVDEFNPGGYYGRCFDMSMVKIGSRLSFFNGQERIYGTVATYIPGKKISLYFRESGGTLEIHDKEHRPLEYQLAIYDLED
jgi:hypothetical protein